MLRERIQADLKQAQLEKNNIEVETLRLLWSEIRYTEIDQGRELDDAGIISVVQREIKKRREAVEGFRKGGREESVQKEEAEAGILAQYLPAQLSDEELNKIINQAIMETGAASVADMGKVISIVIGKVAGRAEGARVSARVKENLKLN